MPDVATNNLKSTGKGAKKRRAEIVEEGEDAEDSDDEDDSRVVQ